MLLRRGMIGGASAAILARAALAQVGPVGGAVGMQFPRSGPGGYGGPGPGAGGAPSLDLSFIDGSTFDPRITYTGSGGTSFNVAGTIVAATTNVPRIDYDPVTHAIRGLLIEEARTNLLLNSATLVTQSVTVTAQAYTLSLYGTGTVTLSGVSTAGPLVGTGAFPARVPLTFTPTAGTLTLTVTGSVLNAQLEAGAFGTSWISTAGTSAARTTDLATVPVAAWFNQAAGTLAADGIFGAVNIVGYTPVMAEIDDGGVTNVVVLRNPGVAAMNATVIVAGATAGTASTGVLAAGAVAKAAMSYNSSIVGLAVNGGAVVTGVVTSLPPSPTRLFIGNGRSSPLGGYVRRIRYWPRALSGGELQVATT